LGSWYFKDRDYKDGIMNKLIFITLFTLCSFALSPAQGGTVDLLSIWAIDKNNKPGGVDEDGDGIIDQGFAASCSGCAVTTQLQSMCLNRGCLKTQVGCRDTQH
jgi:hypothetical protein